MNAQERENVREFLSLISPDAPEARDQRITAWEQIPTAAQLPEEKIEWLVEGMIPRGGVTLVAGESGTYKTWLALCLARGVATGLDFLGRACGRADTLYLDRENPAALMRERTTRLWMDGLSGFRLWGGWVADPPPLIGDARLLELARERKPLMIFDSFIRFHEQDENSASTMALVMNELRALANAGATVVVLHHKPKGEGSQYRGSSDIRAGVDVALAVSADSASRSRNGHAEAAPLIRMVCFKNRLGPEFSLTLRPSLECGGPDSRGPMDPIGVPKSDLTPLSPDASSAPGGNGLEHVSSIARATFARLYASLPGFIVCSSPAAARHSDDVAKLRELITANPGMSQTELMERAEIRENRAISLLREFRDKLWRVEEGPRGAKLFFPVDPEDEEMTSAARPA